MSWQDNVISIVIPTYKRPAALKRLLTSIDGSQVDGFDLEIVIADNDPLASANDVIVAFMETSVSKIIHLHVPEPGVSNARIGALEAAHGRFILFIDDDMEADRDWAKILFTGAQKFDATLAFGPAFAVMPEAGNALFDYMQPLFCRVRDYETGLIDEGIATGNCYLDRGKETLPEPVFDPTLNTSGGEDDALFNHLMQQGAKVAWIEDAITFEHVPAQRATLSYVWRRNFAWGQGPTKHAAEKVFKGVPEVFKWMAVGVVQTGIYFTLWTISKLMSRPKSVQHFGRLAQGVGKVFWAQRLSPKLYGV